MDCRRVAGDTRIGVGEEGALSEMIEDLVKMESCVTGGEIGIEDIELLPERFFFCKGWTWKKQRWDCMSKFSL